MTGYGATFRMWREDYAHGKDGKGRDYNRGEWNGARKSVVVAPGGIVLAGW